MPGPASHGGWRRHIRIGPNAAGDEYGATPSPLNWTWVPLLGDGMKLKATSPRYVPPTNFGEDYRRHVAVHHRQVVEGDITTLLWPEVTQLLLDMALRRVVAAGANYQDLYGHVIEHHTPVDPRRHYGVVANGMRLVATGTGDNDVVLTLSCIGQREESVGVQSPDYSGITPSPFMLAHATIEIDSAVVSDVDAFTLTVDNDVRDAPLEWNNAAGAAVRAFSIADMRTVTLALTKLDNHARFNQAIRQGNNITFEALFRHPDGHILEIILPSLYVEESEEDGSPDTQAKVSPTLVARAADSGLYAGEDIVYGVDLGPVTSTLADITTTAAPTTTTTTAAP